MTILPATIEIAGLEFHAFHGWHAHEAAFGQPFSLDLALQVDIAAVAASDDLADALDYGAVVATARRLFVDERHRLIEAAAVALGRGLLAHFPRIVSLRIKVCKLSPPIPERLRHAGVEVELSRDG